MTISMSDILCVTARRLCEEDFLSRIEKIAKAGPAGIILREKDLTEEEYRKLAYEVLAICREYHTPCILHSFAGAAAKLQCPSLHMPLAVLRTLSKEDRAGFTTIGASCHSLREAMEAAKLGCTYITAGHIFDTDCKKGLPGRGLSFLKEICSNVSLPVYAIGGVCADNIAQVRRTGADGACVMSGLMKCKDVEQYLREFE